MIRSLDEWFMSLQSILVFFKDFSFCDLFCDTAENLSATEKMSSDSRTSH